MSTENVKILLGDDHDLKLDLIDTLTRNRLCNRLGGAEQVPEALEYIVTMVSVAVFNRIGSENFSSHSVEGESISFIDDEMLKYEGDIQAWLDRQEEPTTGRLRFL